MCKHLITYKSHFCTKAVLKQSELLYPLNLYWENAVVQKKAVFHYQMVRKEERLVGWRFILQQDNDPKLQNKRTRQSASNYLETPLKSFRRNWTEEWKRSTSETFIQMCLLSCWVTQKFILYFIFRDLFLKGPFHFHFRVNWNITLHNSGNCKRLEQ